MQLPDRLSALWLKVVRHLTPIPYLITCYWLTCSVQSDFILVAVLEQVLSVVEPGSFKPLRDVRNPFGNIHYLVYTQKTHIHTHTRRGYSNVTEWKPLQSRTAPGENITWFNARPWRSSFWNQKKHPDDDDRRPMKVREGRKCVMTLYENISDGQPGHARQLSTKAQWNGTKKDCLDKNNENNAITLMRILTCAKGLCHSPSRAPEAQAPFYSRTHLPEWLLYILEVSSNTR